MLHFAPYWNGFVDAETGSFWNLHGYALHGPLAGRRLIPRPFLETYWFAWALAHPSTQIAL
ncbi:MAG: DUF3179 domain-containing (seleno)protein [Micromonosporaceae bacterium]